MQRLRNDNKPELRVIVAISLMLFGCSSGDTSLGPGATSDDGTSSGSPETGTAMSPAVPLGVRFEAECAHGPLVGDCGGLLTGSQSGTMLGNGDKSISFFDTMDFLAYQGIEFTGANVMSVAYATGSGGEIELRIDSVDGPVIGSWAVRSTGGWANWTPLYVPIDPPDGTHDLYLVGATGQGIANLDWLEVQQCVPNCEGKECGPDRCGGTCGTCEGTDFCGDASVCEPCVPNCEGKACGDDTCGGVCGDPCGAGEVCDASRACVAYEDLGGPPRVHVDGRSFVNPDGDPVVMRGVSFISLGVQDTQREGVSLAIDSVTGPEWGTEIVRFPIYVVNSANPFPLDDHLAREQWMAGILRPAVDYATAKGLYVIIDLHEISSVTPVKDEEAQRFWSYMAPQFAGYPNVIYEVFNEPIDFSGGCVAGTTDACWPPFKAFAEGWIEIIRATAPDTLVLVGGPAWSQVIGPAADDPIDDPNVGYVGHIYPDHTNGQNGGAVEAQIRRCAAVHPVILTEWGFGFEPNDKEPYATIIRSMVDELDLSFTAWVADYDWSPPMFDLEGNLTEFGTFAQTWLAESAGIQPPDGTTGSETGTTGADESESTGAINGTTTGTVGGTTTGAVEATTTGAVEGTTTGAVEGSTTGSVE